MGNGLFSEISEVVEKSVSRIINQIDPSVLKFKNNSLDIINTVEQRVYSYLDKAVNNLYTNLFLWLFLTVIFILLFVLFLNVFNQLLEKYQFDIEVRKCLALFITTIVIVWLLAAAILSTHLKGRIELYTLKLIFLTVLCLLTFVMVIAWLRYICIYRQHLWPFIRRNFWPNRKNRFDG
ncbi:unnamed protein product [Didymodactylos carnosus]|uniref:Uncharacterized protein n=1 Tax=Didymodactylos carnosus TaxID=1234261 RepID=A0A814IDA8_9BILA|nr:unnamed protein product [Didymodactylos carnosus]CAF1119711.1 unnamed protein product [Didymodactylos carnosus]CAF3791601.1 unnamed protein product [Didymodactylos carnosus]CAF3892612.1 unnamed protein product [Didymodactylos carnosus]